MYALTKKTKENKKNPDPENQKTVSERNKRNIKTSP